MNTYDILEVTNEYSDFVVTEEDKVIDVDGMIEQLTGYNLASKGEIEDTSKLMFIQDRIINQLDINPGAIESEEQREILAIMYNIIEDMLEEPKERVLADPKDIPVEFQSSYCAEFETGTRMYLLTKKELECILKHNKILGRCYNENFNCVEIN